MKRQKIWYLCDGNVPECKKGICYKRVGDSGCKHTSDIKHAINFSVKKYQDHIDIREVGQMTKNHKDMTTEERIKENLRKAKRDSRWAMILSLTAMAINIVRIILKTIA